LSNSNSAPTGQCLQAVNGQWFVQAQVQHVQTSAGTVIAVVPSNFCRTTAQQQQQQSNNNTGTIVTNNVPTSILSAVPSSTSNIIATSLNTSQASSQRHNMLHNANNNTISIANNNSNMTSVNVITSQSNPQQTHSLMQQLLS
uniref:Protein roadkill n=1 Tax=Anisakis simplex TaxID=6269 RepID=A0A0M3JQ27_ANISI